MSQSYLLLTGGAGYVGSHVLWLLLESGENCVVLDNLSNGHEEVIPRSVPFYRADVSNPAVLSEIFETYSIRGILHFAGFIEVGRSMENPGAFFKNNISAAIPLLEKAHEHRVPWIVFSSSAAVYGEPERIPIPEDGPKRPNNPYGVTKWVFENMLHAFDKAFGIRSISLRYFNAAGAHPRGEIGEDHEPESHLIPRACKAALGKLPTLAIYGNDYSTPDKTGIRDYIHVMDLAWAHLLTVKALREGHPSSAYNIGNGVGYSVKQVLDMIEKVSGRPVPTVIAPRRTGDCDILVASPEKFRKEFPWKPEFTELEKIVETAWQWHERYPEGFRYPEPGALRERNLLGQQ